MIESLIFPGIIYLVFISFIWLIKQCFAASSEVKSNQTDCKLIAVIALDTERVGAGPRGSINVLARVSMVNRNGKVIYDEYVKPFAPVTDYRTPWSGIRERDLVGAKDFLSVKQEVAQILEDCILVGHDLEFDLGILNLIHPVKYIRDTAHYKLFRQLLQIEEKPSLKFLAKTCLGMDIQVGEHCSVEDARAAMDLYLLVEKQWEKELLSY